MRLEEGHNEEETFWRKVWACYVSVTRPLWQLEPMVLTEGLQLAYPYRKVRGYWEESRQACTRIIQYIFSEPAPRLPIPAADVILFYPSPKPGMKGPIDALAQRLALQGVRSLVISKNSIEHLSVASDGRIEKTLVADRYGKDFVRGERSVRSALRVLYGVVLTIVLKIWLLFRAPNGLRKVVPPFAKMVEHFVLEMHRYAVCRRIIASAQPMLFVTNLEGIAMAGGMMFAKTSGEITRVLYHYDLPDTLFWPIHADEVWVWNEEIGSQVRAERIQRESTRCLVMGNPEIDLALEQIACETSTAAEEELLQQVDGRPVLLYLSQFGPKGDAFSRSPEEAIGWLVQALQDLPDLVVIAKTRPFKGYVEPLAAKLAKENDRFLVSAHEDISFARFLAWEELKAVCAIWSIGLFTAAGVGTPAIRMKVPSHQLAYPVLDRACRVTESAEVFTDQLQSVIALPAEVESEPGFDQSRVFPNRGMVLEKMTERCLELMQWKRNDMRTA